MSDAAHQSHLWGSTKGVMWGPDNGLRVSLWRGHATVMGERIPVIRFRVSVYIGSVEPTMAGGWSDFGTGGQSFWGMSVLHNKFIPGPLSVR